MKKELRSDIEKLVSLGQKKGFLTYDEVNSTLSDGVDSVEEIDHVFDLSLIHISEPTRPY